MAVLAYWFFGITGVASVPIGLFCILAGFGDAKMSVQISADATKREDRLFSIGVACMAYLIILALAVSFVAMISPCVAK